MYLYLSGHLFICRSRSLSLRGYSNTPDARALSYYRLLQSTSQDIQLDDASRMNLVKSIRDSLSASKSDMPTETPEEGDKGTCC